MSVNLYFISMSEQTYLMSIAAITLAATFFIVFLTVKRMKNPYPKLSKFVKNSFENGNGLIQIRDSLVNAGWDENVVDNELRKFQ